MRSKDFTEIHASKKKFKILNEKENVYAVELYENGLPQKKISEKLDVSEVTIRKVIGRIVKKIHDYVKISVIS